MGVPHRAPCPQHRDRRALRAAFAGPVAVTRPGTEAGTGESADGLSPALSAMWQHREACARDTW